jgi:predicted signal transduction protein with EAL and GGDEF domain
MSTVRVARRLSLRTIAEHVHSQPVFDRLREIGVDYLQGDLFGKPQPIDMLFNRFPDCATGSEPADAGRAEADALASGLAGEAPEEAPGALAPVVDDVGQAGPRQAH